MSLLEPLYTILESLPSSRGYQMQENCMGAISPDDQPERSGPESAQLPKTTSDTQEQIPYHANRNLIITLGRRGSKVMGLITSLTRLTTRIEKCDCIGPNERGLSDRALLYSGTGSAALPPGSLASSRLFLGKQAAPHQFAAGDATGRL